LKIAKYMFISDAFNEVVHKIQVKNTFFHLSVQVGLRVIVVVVANMF
jgi:hypothetical protein